MSNNFPLYYQKVKLLMWCNLRLLMWWNWIHIKNMDNTFSSMLLQEGVKGGSPIPLNV